LSTAAAAAVLAAAQAIGDGTPAPDSCQFQITQSVPVPANIPAIPAMKRFIQGGIGELSVTSASAGSFRAEQDPRSDLYFLIRPEQPLVAGESVTIDLAVTCNGTAVQPAPLTLQAVAAAPLPTSLGTVDVDADRRRARVVLSPEMIPFVSTLAVTSVLEGGGDATTKPLVYYGLSALTREVLVGTSSFGSSVPGLDPNAVHQIVVSDVALADALCGERRSGEQDYSLRVSGHIAGADADPPDVIVPLAVGCDRPKGRPGDPQESSDSDEGGCAMRRSGDSSGWPLVAVVLGIMLRVRFRSSSRARSDRLRRSPSRPA
jgi:hypothetical protein